MSETLPSLGECQDAIKRFGIEVSNCCESCHWDRDNGYDLEMMDIEVDGEGRYEVCCAVWNVYADEIDELLSDAT